MGSKKYRNPEKRQAKASAKAEQRNNPQVAQPVVVSNTFWDDARDLYEKSIWAVQYTHGQLSDYLRSMISNPETLEKMKDNVELISNIQLLTRDIGEHKDRLTAIYQMHKDRSGGSTTPDEHMSVIRIHGEYHDALEMYESTIMPTVTHIFEQIGIIDQFLEEQKTEEVPAAPVEEMTDVVAVELNPQEEGQTHD